MCIVVSGMSKECDPPQAGQSNRTSIVDHLDPNNFQTSAWIIVPPRARLGYD